MIEEGPGTALPADSRSPAAVSAWGVSGYLHAYGSPGGADPQVVDWPARMRRTQEERPITRNGFEPYGLYRPGGRGLIHWGMSVTATGFCRSADAEVPPAGRPVVVRSGVGDRRLLPMSASECLFRVLTDVTFGESTVAHLVVPPFLAPYEA
ncbi:SMI1/KNR4 family protein [Nocardiopsis sp. CC223A]|uniref:SMI1/KNR4 family protein n=1 Tax=Nocardiopsis sp. CC223A TaxID=3044051 RepID=UPI002795AB4B|nr:SMI1/KNR4 family protein [Nocardiopsis sp. CC223A]